MYTEEPKKLLIIHILNILQKYSDADNRLSQKQIIEKLKAEYGMTAERKSVRRNIIDLIDCGYPIEYSKNVRMIRNAKTGEPEESEVISDIYLEHNFTGSELRLLIDNLLFSKPIPYHQCKELIGKLEGLSSEHFRSHIKHIHAMSNTMKHNESFFLTIDLLDEAILRSRKVTFKYLEYGTDKELHAKKRADGSVREYTVSPYQMAAKEGKYYLICNYDKYNDLSNYRVDRITDVKIMDEPVKDFSKLDGTDNGRFDLAKYMADHVYMYSGKNIRATFLIVKPMISDIIDMFGTDVRFSDETETHVTISALVDDEAMAQFAKSYAPDVVVLSPQSLVDRIKTDIAKAMEAYN